MGVTLLIIEADPILRENLAKRLACQSWRVLAADPITDAKKMVKRKNIDVVVLGLTWLKREGLAILQVIKKVRPLTEVILINRSDQIALSIEGMKLGAFDDFMSPFNIDALIHRIQDACRQKKQREKEKKPLLRRCMDTMTAGAFAEAGEPEMALAYLENEKKPISKTDKKGAENGKD
jgi:DNA-binding NtrC family response regulator